MSFFLPAFKNDYLSRLDDQPVLQIEKVNLAFTTDTFIVAPNFFHGGDIGRLAIYGTVDDLAMRGYELACCVPAIFRKQSASQPASLSF